ncbi:MAG: hypothetical protein ACSHYF_04045 [Verrucomicrobiaceae bacterium]
MRLSILLLIISLLLPTSLSAGSRGVNLAFLDATTGTRSKASIRLAELLEKDMRALYVDAAIGNAFPWNEHNLKLTILKLKEADLSFDALLNTKDAKKLPTLFEKIENPDGLIVFFHDEKNGFARLKLYSWDGQEALLIRLPLEGPDSPMPASLLKTHRRGALIALGAAVRWSP